MSLADGVCGTGGYTGPLPGDPDNNSVLTAVAVYGGIEVSWTYPTLNPEAVAFVQLWRGTTNDINTALLHRITSGNSYLDLISDDNSNTWYYWIKITSVYGTEGAPIGPAIATTVPISTQMIALLEGKLSTSALTNALQTQIGGIATVTNGLQLEVQDRLFGDSAISSSMVTLQTETAELTTAIIDETTARTAADSAQVTAINAIGAQVNDPSTGLTTKASVSYVDQAEADAVSASATASALLISSVGAQNLYYGASPDSVAAGVESEILFTLKSVAAGNTAALLPGEKLTLSAVLSQDSTSAAANQYSGLKLYTRNAVGTVTSEIVLTGPLAVTTSVYDKDTFTLPALEADMVDVIIGLYHMGGTGTYAGEVYADRIQVERGSIATAYKVASAVDMTVVNAAISAEALTRSTADSALASDITTIQTTVGGHTTSIQTNASSIDGLEAQYTVKVDNNGYVSGFGLASTPVDGVPTSEFTVVADKFSIAPVATAHDAADGSPFFHLTVPTTIESVPVPAGTYMKSAYIHDASITNAKIGNVIQSADYVAGSAGWKIDKAGSMEMSNATFRGTLEAATGSFAGSLTAATGSFAGSLSAATGSFAGSLSAATGSFSGELSATTGTFGEMTVATGGHIKQGQTAYNTGIGFWLGDDAGTAKFSLGNPSGKHIRWDGSNLFVRGDVNADSRIVVAGTSRVLDANNVPFQNSEAIFGKKVFAKAITMKHSGTVRVSVNAVATVTGISDIFLYKNGYQATLLGSSGISDIYSFIVLSTSVSVQPGDVLELWWQKDSSVGIRIDDFDVRTTAVGAGGGLAKSLIEPTLYTDGVTYSNGYAAGTVSVGVATTNTEIPAHELVVTRSGVITIRYSSWTNGQSCSFCPWLNGVKQTARSTTSSSTSRSEITTTALSVIEGDRISLRIKVNSGTAIGYTDKLQILSNNIVGNECIVAY